LYEKTLSVLIAISRINYYLLWDDWPDDAICMWLEQKPTH